MCRKHLPLFVLWQHHKSSELPRKTRICSFFLRPASYASNSCGSRGQSAPTCDVMRDSEQRQFAENSPSIFLGRQSVCSDLLNFVMYNKYCTNIFVQNHEDNAKMLNNKDDIWLKFVHSEVHNGSHWKTSAIHVQLWEKLTTSNWTQLSSFVCCAAAFHWTIV